MKRGKKIVLLAHCLLNPNAKVNGLAATAGALPLIKELVDAGCGLVQLPCPEHSYLGGKRWGMTVEQYDTAAYRAHCRKLLEPILNELLDYTADGYSLDCVLGMDGSPSCGVGQTCFGYAGGEISGLNAAPACDLLPGSGVFMTVFKRMLAENDLEIPFVGLDELNPAKADWPSLLAAARS